MLSSLFTPTEMGRVLQQTDSILWRPIPTHYRTSPIHTVQFRKSMLCPGTDRGHHQLFVPVNISAPTFTILYIYIYMNTCFVHPPPIIVISWPAC